LYANRDWDSIIFREELETLKQRLNLTLIYILDKPAADWQGETGFITPALLDQYLPKEKARNLIEVFICGPGPMMDAVEKALVQVGVPIGDFHSERFNLV
jgi:predicted ferric reductase